MRVFLKALNDFRISREHGLAAGPELSQELLKKELDAYHITLQKEIPTLKKN